MTADLPWYFSVHDRPVKVVRTLDDGADVLVLDLQSGEFVREVGLLDAYFEVRPGVESLTRAEFDALVETHRARRR